MKPTTISPTSPRHQHRLVEARQDVARLAEKGVAGMGERDVPLVAVQQSYAQLPFE